MLNSSLTSTCLSPTSVIRLTDSFSDKLERLKNKHTELLFGGKTVVTHLNEHFLSLGIPDEMDTIVGAICLDSFPNIPALPPWEFAHWLRNLYGIADIDPRTALWCHFAVYDRCYTLLFLQPILQYFFQHYEAMEKVVFVCPPGIARIDFLEQIATRMLPIGFVNPRTVQTLYVIKKDAFVCQYTIRRAVEEDNDDLIAIIPKIVEETYGPYYIAELLSLEETGRRLIVAEHEGCAVGVLCLNECVNYDLLNENFELVVYNGLRKPHDDDEVLSQQLSTVGLTLWDDLEATSENSEASEDDMIQQMDNEVVSEAHSEDDYSLFNISSSLLLRYLYEDNADDDALLMDGGHKSQESTKSGPEQSSEDYADHVFTQDRDQDISIIRFARDRESKNQMGELPVPLFRGDANAFALEICASLPDHENCLYLLCQAAFECFPDRDYCVVSFPPAKSCPYLTKHFGRVMSRNNTYFSHDLYILHRSAILCTLSVRVALDADKSAVTELVANFHKNSTIWDIFNEAIHDNASPLRAFVFLCGSQIIGAAVLNEEKDIHFLQMHYFIDPWVNTSCKLGPYGAIECFVLSPIFQRHQGFFVRELHRLGNFYVLFYRLRRHDFLIGHRTIPIVNAIQVMAPVMSRTRLEYNKAVADEFDLPEAFTRKPPQHFSLYLTSARLMSRPMVEINDRIVIVGVGLTALSFLESLLFNKNSRGLIFFTNLSIISSYDVFAHKPRRIEDMLFVNHGDAENQHKEYLWLKTYVQIVTGVMTSIERREKYIVLNEDSYLPYDYLFLLCGEQFQRPPHKRFNKQQRKSEVPSNLFVLNSGMDASMAFDHIRQMDPVKKSGTIVVFGHYLEALCCLNALLESGVLGTNLVYIDPSPESNPTNARHDHLSQFFNNSLVENTVLEELLTSGITVYQDYNIVDWYYENESDNFITSAKFESKYKFIEIELSSLFVYHSRTVSARTFHAIIRAGLVFNGQLVIDDDFCTNDPNIYSAGPMTKYSQKYHCEDRMHKYYNSNEIGYELGLKIRRKLIPDEYKDMPVVETGRKSRPIVQYARFPGHLHYLQVSKPGRPIPLEVAMNKAHYGKVLVTGNAYELEQQGYFRLHFNQYFTVETITCLSKFEFNVQHLISLYGKHASLFNNLVHRFEMKLVPCLFEYFEQPWMYAIFHSDFNDLLWHCSNLFRTIQTVEGTLLVDELHKIFDGNYWKKMKKEQTKQFEALCQSTPIFKVIEQKLLKFLDDNYIYLPMYAHHMLIRWIIGCNRTNPLFHENRGFGEHPPNTYLRKIKNSDARGGDTVPVSTCPSTPASAE